MTMLCHQLSSEKNIPVSNDKLQHLVCLKDSIMQHPGVLLLRYLMFLVLSLSHKLFTTFEVFVELHVSAAYGHHQV
jgi:hypothetical protein